VTPIKGSYNHLKKIEFEDQSYLETNDPEIKKSSNPFSYQMKIITDSPAVEEFN